MDEVTAYRRLPIARGTQAPDRSGSRPDRLSKGPAHNIQDLLDVAIGVALLGRVSDTALDVVFENEESDGVHRRPQSSGLLEDVDAVLPAFDHALDATDLAGDAPQPPNQDLLIT